jgi:hypothetical protein
MASTVWNTAKIVNETCKKKELILPRIELGTFCVLSRCHNQLDHKTISCLICGARTISHDLSNIQTESINTHELHSVSKPGSEFYF